MENMMIGRRQPTKTSCGPTCVAMLLGKEPQEVIAALKVFKTKKQDKTSVLDVSILFSQLSSRSLNRIGVRIKSAVAGTGLLKWHRKTPAGQYRAGWHWVVLAYGRVYDPTNDEAMLSADWFTANGQDKVIFHEVQ